MKEVRHLVVFALGGLFASLWWAAATLPLVLLRSDGFETYPLWIIAGTVTFIMLIVAIGYCIVFWNDD